MVRGRDKGLIFVNYWLLDVSGGGQFLGLFSSPVKRKIYYVMNEKGHVGQQYF